jgi:Mg-chelatase subunit ChlI
MRRVFPFVAIVGQERMRMALILNAINPQIGGVLIRGERGSAKSTAARGLAELLPPIVAVSDCPFGCDPDVVAEQCDTCRARVAAGESLPRCERATRVVDLPVSATEDRVVGTLDIESAIRQGERRFEPGVLAAANRGLLYIDEVNLLDDHVVDLLLDCAAMGTNLVEREGISFSHPARFMLVGSMNPEEGDLRPQLLDRFALCVDVQSVASAEERKLILERCLAFEREPDAFCRTWRREEGHLAERIGRARELVPAVGFRDADLLMIGEFMSEMRVDGHRGDLVVLKTALTHAAFEGRSAIGTRDLVAAAELALPHRLKRRPLQDVAAPLQVLAERLAELREAAEIGPELDGPHHHSVAAPTEKKTSRTR